MRWIRREWWHLPFLRWFFFFGCCCRVPHWHVSVTPNGRSGGLTRDRPTYCEMPIPLMVQCIGLRWWINMLNITNTNILHFLPHLVGVLWRYTSPCLGRSPTLINFLLYFIFLLLDCSYCSGVRFFCFFLKFWLLQKNKTKNSPTPTSALLLLLLLLCW